jgi:hypothetical protein
MERRSGGMKGGAVTDIVDKLRSTQRVTQYDSAGRLIQFDGTPTDREREAAEHIDSLRAALRKCQTLTPSLMDGEAAKERLKEINRHVYAVFGQ